jgi:hypothetical protein
VLGVACLSAAPVVAQAPAAPPPPSGGAGPEAEIAHLTAPVILDGETLFRVRSMTYRRAFRVGDRIRVGEVLQTSLGDFCVVYEINAYCNAPGEMGGLYTRLHQNILDVFNEHGVQIMTPAYEGDPGEPKVVPKEQWWSAPARPPAPGPPDGDAST